MKHSCPFNLEAVIWQTRAGEPARAAPQTATFSSLQLHFLPVLPLLVCRTSWQLFCCGRRHYYADRGTFDMEGDHRWEAAQKTSCRVRASFQAGFNFHVKDAPQDIFHFSTYISEGQMYPLKAIYDFNIGTQDRVAQAKHPHFFSETVISDKVCAKQSANWGCAFYFEDE